MSVRPDPSRLTALNHGIQPWNQRPAYQTYKSPFGPKYATEPHFHGISLRQAAKYGTTAAGFGAVAGVFAIFFFAEVPRVREDIMKKVPILGSYFNVEIAPEDNPF
ncbi:Cytochrome b-c1 complex subunit 10 [Macrophomina phaseolina MS6]|uniref:Cytochrome b-c1 complex subunit 10 n=1 Tax=Macrophomina phaseolina (strain MS6) TaxID=1126212 RepID=K2SSK2_MACPH|nr:Cytochrome b-c1 complex subunit 10 [Macrophomina phaseolina MS6]